MKSNLTLCAATTAALLAAGSPLTAQETAPLDLFTSTPPATQPTTQPTTQAATQAAIPAVVVPPGIVTPEGKMIFNFQGASLDSVLSFLSQATGVVVIGDTKVEGRVNVLSKQPVTLDEAFLILNAVLKDNGYAAVREGKTVRIVSLDAAKKANIPVRTGNDPDKVTASDEVVTQVIPVRYADASQLKKDLASLVPAYADLTANVSTNTLILTDSCANIKRMLQIIKSLDTAISAVTQVKVFPLKYANASTTAKLLNDIFKTETAPSQQNNRGGFSNFFSRFSRGGGGGFPGGGGGGGGGEEQQTGGRPQVKVNVSSDDRTNTVVVSAPADTMPVIEEVLKELDSNPAQDQIVNVYYLRNADATNVQNVINSLFGGTTSGGGRTTGATRTNQTGTSRTSTSTGLAGFGGSSSSGRSGSSSVGLNTSNFGSTSNTSRASSRTAGSLPVRPSSMGGDDNSPTALIGQVFVVADVDTNSLLIMASSGNFEQVKKVIEQMDRPIPQVLIKVLLAEVTHNNDIDLGVEFSGINLQAGLPEAGKSNISTKLGGPGGLTALQAANGGLMYQYVSGDFAANIRALQTIGKVDVLSRPYILGSDNQTSSIIVGDSVPIITDSRLDTNNNTINTIQYQNVGIILNVTPHINPDGVVIMDVAPEISQVLDSTVQLSPGVSSPQFSIRAAQTRVAIKDNQTIVIGGLMQDQKNQNVSQVPLLGDIPLLGELFKRNDDKKTKTELLIYLTPHVADVPDKLPAMTASEQKGAVIAPKAVGKGVFEEHLRGMQRGGQDDVPPPTTQPDDVK